MTAEKFGEKYLIWIILAVIGFFVVRNYWGDKVPGAFFERGHDYQTSVYVNLYPTGSASKNYHVKGDIEKVDGAYILEKIYWPNGGSSSFDDCQNLTLTTKEYCRTTNYDDTKNGEEYDVQLTNEFAQ